MLPSDAHLRSRICATKESMNGPLASTLLPPDPIHTLLQATLRVGLGWMNQVAQDDPRRNRIVQMRLFIGGRLLAEDRTRDTLTTVRAMFCINCRSIHPGLSAICCGRPLDQCYLLK
jgi:hypothetical protein